MSYKLVDLVLGMVGLELGPKAVLIALASYARDDGRGCFAGQRKIAERVGCGERAARKYLAFLDRRGLIRRTHRYRNDGTRTSDGYELSIRAIANYRHDVPVANPDYRRDVPDGTAGNRDYRHIVPPLPAQMAATTGTNGRDYRHDAPGKNLSEESVSGIYQSNLSDPSPDPLPGGDAAAAQKPAVAARPESEIEKSQHRTPETEAERVERIEAERQRQLRLARRCFPNTSASVGKPAPPRDGAAPVDHQVLALDSLREPESKPKVALGPEFEAAKRRYQMYTARAARRKANT